MLTGAWIVSMRAISAAAAATELPDAGHERLRCDTLSSDRIAKYPFRLAQLFAPGKEQLMSKKTLIWTLAPVLVCLSAIFAATHEFIPDFAFKGSSLTGWRTLGQATWRAENGELIATPQSADGGWLMMDKGYQD